MKMLSFRHAFAVLLLLWNDTIISVANAQGACGGSCQYCFSTAAEVRWQPKVFSTTITAATVIEIINTDLDTTRYSTIYNELPSGYTMPTNTNAEGTQTVQFTYTRTGDVLTTELAFPTEFTVYPSAYTWTGTVLTTDGYGDAICSVADSPATVTFDDFPQTLPTAVPSHSLGPDPMGLMFEAAFYPGFMLPSDIYWGDAVPQDCDVCNKSLPAVQHYSARFYTVTSTSIEQASGNAFVRRFVTTSEVRPTTTDTGSRTSSIVQTVPVVIVSTSSSATQTPSPTAGTNAASESLQTPLKGTVTALVLYLFVLLYL